MYQGDGDEEEAERKGGDAYESKHLREKEDLSRRETEAELQGDMLSQMLDRDAEGGTALVIVALIN